MNILKAVLGGLFLFVFPPIIGFVFGISLEFSID